MRSKVFCAVLVSAVAVYMGWPGAAIAADRMDPRKNPPPGNALQMPSRMARWGVIYMFSQYSCFDPRKPQDIQLNRDGVTFSWTGSEERISRNFLDVKKYVAVARSRVNGVDGKKTDATTAAWGCWTGPARDANATRFADALNHLLYERYQGRPPNDEPDGASFQLSATTWRTLATKPDVSDAVYRERVLAENAYKEKDSLSALEHYEQGLTVDGTWAQGWFNAALLFAELKNYSEAASHMRRYLILLPGAPDGRAAKDSIIIWEDKAAKPAAVAAPPKKK